MSHCRAQEHGGSRRRTLGARAGGGGGTYDQTVPPGGQLIETRLRRDYNYYDFQRIFLTGPGISKQILILFS